MNILFGIEIQSVPDKNMPVRIAGYIYLSYVILDKNKEKKIPVIMIVLYVGERKWKEGIYEQKIEIAIQLKKNGKLSNVEITFIIGLSIEQLAML